MQNVLQGVFTVAGRVMISPPTSSTTSGRSTDKSSRPK